MDSYEIHSIQNQTRAELEALGLRPELIQSYLKTQLEELKGMD